MAKPKRIISRTERILSIFDMFQNFEEVSMLELSNSFRGHKRTFSRDIALLKRAGVPIRYSGRRKAFVLTDEAGNESPRGNYRAAPEFPEGKKERQYFDKIRRLITMMDEVPYEDCNVWYRETFPESSKRTMQRDFAVLNRVLPGCLYYKREWDNPFDKDDGQPPGHYYVGNFYFEDRFYAEPD
jgi:predicted DNA-binding transcriptional regulator YafY